MATQVEKIITRLKSRGFHISSSSNFEVEGKWIVLTKRIKKFTFTVIVRSYTNDEGNLITMGAMDTCFDKYSKCPIAFPYNISGKRLDEYIHFLATKKGWEYSNSYAFWDDEKKQFPNVDDIRNKLSRRQNVGW